MPFARKIVAKIVLFVGIALGLAALTLWANLLWPIAAAEPVPKNAMRIVFLIFFGGFGALGLIVWPFAWLAERINPPQADVATALKTAPRSRPLRSRVLRQAKQQ